MKNFLITNWFKIGILVVALVAASGVFYSLVISESKNFSPTEVKSATAETGQVPTITPSPVATSTPATTTNLSINNHATPPRPTKATAQVAAPVDPAIKIEECKAKASTENIAFIQAMNIVMANAEANSSLVKNHDGIIASLEGQLSPSQFSELPANIQQLINSGDRNAIDFNLELMQQEIQQAQINDQATIQTDAQAAYNQDYLDCLNS